MLPVLQALVNRVIAEDQNRQSTEIIQLPPMGGATAMHPNSLGSATASKPDFFNGTSRPMFLLPKPATRLQSDDAHWILDSSRPVPCSERFRLGVHVGRT